MDLPPNLALDVAGIKYEGSGLLKRGELTSQVGTQEKPLYIHIDSDTDWPAVAPSVAGVIVAIIVAVFTVKVQKTQIRANISSFRHQWINDLRLVSSEYLQSLYSMAVRLKMNDDYFRSEQQLKDYDKILVLTTRFEMLLSRDDGYTQEILACDQRVMDVLSAYNKEFDFNQLTCDVNLLKDLVRKELERAWEDIKADVGFRSRKKKAKVRDSIMFWRASYS
ncbi:hypothetical protein [Pseudomonas asplenii]|uniref:hypothetical protein n=1 Tax=Pseudomonas asplenii TaxID=53407 RepID=UPI0006B431FC|nr:hypothetical protein [Pseudomonas fuscovaginae]KPA95396.1 hypothetical protein PF70_04582 [Pseudomonas fuscovaginae]